MQCRQKTVEDKRHCTTCNQQFCPKCLSNRYGPEQEEVGTGLTPVCDVSWSTSCMQLLSCTHHTDCSTACIQYQEWAQASHYLANAMCTKTLLSGHGCIHVGSDDVLCNAGIKASRLELPKVPQELQLQLLQEGKLLFLLCANDTTLHTHFLILSSRLGCCSNACRPAG